MSDCYCEIVQQLKGTSVFVPGTGSNAKLLSLWICVPHYLSSNVGAVEATCMDSSYVTFVLQTQPSLLSLDEHPSSVSIHP